MNNRISSLAALLTLAGLASTGLGSALAADLPARTYTPAPVYVAPIYNWTGFYIGANLGGEWGNGRLTEYTTLASLSNTRTSFIGGGQLGYNYMFNGGFVLGAEWTFDWGGRNSGTVVTAVPTVGTFSASANGAQWLTTVTGRAGFAMDRTLFYVKGGGAWLESSVNITCVSCAGTPNLTSNKTRSGFDVGGGIEYAVTQNWTVKGEYNYISASSWTTPVTNVGQFKVTGNIQSFVLGVNYKF
jgi:outer membrane immunogenic protein